MPRFLPKSVVCWREGYTARTVLGDLLAGVTVGVIALPLALAFGINSIPPERAAEAGVSPPAMGLYTAIVAGFLISALGGSRVQIGGPTAAFVGIVYGVANLPYGVNGLIVATLMAGVMVLLMGVFRFGMMIKFIPHPVTTGFTSGIALYIVAQQVKDFLGLQMEAPPAEFLGKIEAYAAHIGTWNPWAAGVAGGSLAGLILLRRFAPRLPGAMIVVVASSAIVGLANLPVETIGGRFGALPSSLPTPHLPAIAVSMEMIRDLLPHAATIAMLAAIESLLSAVVADGMTGGRHKADCELVAQGVANIASVVFGGIPATGAIARTAANVKSGGKTPLAGMIHALTLLVILLVAAPLASTIPLATLSAVLIVVAWNMAEIEQFRSILKAPGHDVVVLLTAFGLTVFVDLTMAVGVGLVLASLLFMKRMADVSNISALTQDDGDAVDELGERSDPNSVASRELPPGVEVYEINGPFFFGVADRLQDTLRGLERPPKVFILRMRKVPAIDASGLHALGQFHTKCRRQGTTLLLSGVHAQPLFAFMKVGFDEVVGSQNMLGGLDDALDRAREILGLPAAPHPEGATPEVARAKNSRSRAS